MKLFIFKQDRTNLWWACIISPGRDWEPASPFLSWDSALRAGLEKLKREQKRRESQARLKDLLGSGRVKVDWRDPAPRSLEWWMQ